MPNSRLSVYERAREARSKVRAARGSLESLRGFLLDVDFEPSASDTFDAGQVLQLERQMDAAATTLARLMRDWKGARR